MLRALILSSLLVAAPAAADVTGRYRAEGGKALTVEVDEAGVARIQADDQAVYALFDGTDGYVVSNEGGVTRVARLSDISALVAEAIGGVLGPLLPQAPAQAPEEAGRWVAIGPEAVEGRTGIAYRRSDEQSSEGRKVVLSEDAQLAPLGLAWSRSFAQVPLLGALFGPAATRPTEELGELLRTRAPLQLGDMRLMSASFDEVDPMRFVLPATPMTREEVAAMMREQQQRGGDQDGEDDPEDQD